MTNTVATKTINGQTVEIREHKDYRDKYPKRKRKYDIYIDGNLELEKRVNNSNRQNPEGLFDVAERRIDAIGFEKRVISIFKESNLVKHKHGGYGPTQDSNIRFVIGSSTIGKNIGNKDKIVQVLERKVKRTHKYKSMPQQTKPKSWQQKEKFRDLNQLSKYITKSKYKD